MSFRRGVSYVPHPKFQASGNPEHCKQFGFVLNRLEPLKGPFRTVYICPIAPI